MKRFLRVAAWTCLILALAVFGATWPIEKWFASRAVLCQRVEPSAESALFGEVGTKIGSPQMVIVSDPKAFLSSSLEGSAPPSASPSPLEGEGLPGSGRDGVGGGARLLNERYLRENGIYPLQLRTVRFFAYWTRIGCAAAAILAVLALFWIRRPR